MEENMRVLWDIKEEQLKKALELNNMSLTVVKDQEELKKHFQGILIDQKKVAVGGSVTLSQMGLIDLLRESDVDFIDRYEPGIDREEMQNRFRQAFFADIFLTSTNALTMDGCLYNIDGNGNRVAAMIYGPKEVYVVAGLNKIFNNEEEAIEHIRQYSAPANAIRLNKNTPCSKVGHCQDCLSPDRICSSYVKLGRQGQKRIHIILVEENLGY